MKKIFFFVFFICLFSIFKIESKSNYNYLKNDESYNIYSVSMDNLNTKNIVNYFNNIDVIEIYPLVNPIYKSRIGNVSYKLRGGILNNEISLFTNYYLSLIKKNSYLDYNYLYINGIAIDKVDIYISGRDLYNFLMVNDAYIS